MAKKTDHATYWSLDQYADTAESQGKSHYSQGDSSSWNGGAGWDASLKLARFGWNEQLEAALELAESAVQTAERDHVIQDKFDPVWDVTGAEVDVARYLSGEPECMIDFPLSSTSKAGRVIALCASIAYSGSIGPETIRRRGRIMVALAMALSRLGHNTELWADLSGSNSAGTFRIRVLVKGANDELDPSKVMFAYAHPAMLRMLGFSAIERLGHSVMSKPVGPERDLPEGAIYLPEICSDHDVPDAGKFLRQYLGELGLLAE